jgi:glyoxylase-like metal-dependent hydrolase (beta-lactamase superfamily II)
VVIDPGDEAGAIISRLRELRWVPLYIFLTHGHFDHLMALPDLLEAFGKDAKAGIHRLDAHYLGKDAMRHHRDSFAAAGGNPVYFDTLRISLDEADILFEEGDKAGPFRVLHLPGHTPGSAGFYDETNGILFSGDTLFRGDRGRTDLPGGNEEEIQKSLKRLFSMKSGTVVCPGHGPATTIKEEAASS